MSPWPNVSPFRDRHGHTRWRFRRQGYATVTLHGEPGSEQFMAELAAARSAGPLSIGSSKVRPGSLSAVIAAYYESAKWRSLAPITKTTYRGELERFRAKNGDRPAGEMRRQDVLRFLDKKAATPAAANHLLQVLRIVMRFALDRGMISSDPTYRVKKLKVPGDGFPPWTEANIETFKEKWPTGSRPRLAMALLLETGQRRGDVIRMGRQHVRGGRMHVVQSKTGRALSIRVSDELAAELERAPKGHLTYLVTDKGAPYTAAGFGNWFREVCDKAGLGFVSAHGLRKAKARRLAEDGATAHEIAAITGHKSLAEVQRYTESADQERLADRAMNKARPRTDLATPTGDNLATLKIV